MAAIICHFVVSWRVAKRLELRRRVWVGISIGYMLAMMVGAKALYDVGAGEFAWSALLEPAHYMQGGLWGGLMVYLVMAGLGAVVWAKSKRKTLDLMVLVLPAPLVLAKLACLCNGCCYGSESALPWAITFPEGSKAVVGVGLHPTQIYEMMVAGCVFLVFRRLDYERWRGTMVLWFIAVYGLGRAFTEIWRSSQEQQTYLGPLTVSQVICLAGAVVAVVAIYWIYKRNIRANVSN